MNMNASTTSDIDFLFDKTVQGGSPEGDNSAPRGGARMSIDMLNLGSPPKSSLQSNSFAREPVDPNFKPERSVLEAAADVKDFKEEEVNSGNLLAKHTANIARLASQFGIDIKPQDQKPEDAPASPPKAEDFSKDRFSQKLKEIADEETKELAAEP